MRWLKQATWLIALRASYPKKPLLLHHSASLAIRPNMIRNVGPLLTPQDADLRDKYELCPFGKFQFAMVGTLGLTRFWLLKVCLDAGPASQMLHHQLKLNPSFPLFLCFLSLYLFPPHFLLIFSPISKLPARWFWSAWTWVVSQAWEDLL